jgi:hypothetical protein
MIAPSSPQAAIVISATRHSGRKREADRTVNLDSGAKWFVDRRLMWGSLDGGRRHGPAAGKNLKVKAGQTG